MIRSKNCVDLTAEIRQEQKQDLAEGFIVSTNNPEATVVEFFRAFNERNMEAVLALYEPKAVLLAQPGQMAEGTASLRAALDGFWSMKPTLTMGKNRMVTVGDLALSLVNWTLRGIGPDGKAIEMAGTTSDVLRRQANGQWLFVIDNPWGAAIVG